MCDCPLCRLARWWLGDQIEEAPEPTPPAPVPISPALAQQYQALQNAYAVPPFGYQSAQLGQSPDLFRPYRG